MLVIDTGSSWMWVSGDECVDLSDCPESSAFHYLLSDSYEPTKGTKKIVYGDGSTEGLIVSDTVSASASDELKVDKFSFIKVDSEYDYYGKG